MTPLAARASELDTPALLIDLDIMERNLGRVAGYAQEHGLRLRPHTKTHKIPALARRQLDLGAVGLTVAKVGEAEVMLDAAPPDLLVAYPTIGARKLERLMQVARKTQVTVALDSLTAAQQLSDASRSHQIEIGVLTEVDVGLGRVGVAPGRDLLDLIEAVERLPNLRWEGIAFYPGQIKKLDGEGERELEKLAHVIEAMLQDLGRAGFKARIVSGGSTPTLFHSHRLEGVTEIRPGTYIFNDCNTVLSGAADWQDCAASILVTVVSTAKKGQMIVDGGSKTFSSDRPTAGEEVSFGRVVEAPEAVFTKMNEEHGFIALGEPRKNFEVGDRVRIIPNHICVAMNLHECVYGIRGDVVEQVWRVEGRGKLQ
jgi:D-serine deaminase-like pyridoxal phosphate-dependent protein